MTIALTACDSKKELMVQFCIAYAGVLSRHNLYATSTTGRMVSEVTGLTIRKFPSERQGGNQLLASKISCNEIDLLIYFRDTAQDGRSLAGFGGINGGNSMEGLELIQACDHSSVPLATNIATAEILIHGLERGDFDWRNNVNQPVNGYFRY